MQFPKIYLEQLLSQISAINSDSSVHSNIEIVLVHSTISSETNPTNFSLFSCLFETDTNLTSQFLTENDINFMTLRDSLTDYVCHSDTDTLLPTPTPTHMPNNGNCAENGYEIHYLHKETFSDVLHCYRYNISTANDTINEWSVYLPKYCDNAQIVESEDGLSLFELVFHNLVNQSMEFEVCLFVIDSILESESDNALIITLV